MALGAAHPLAALLLEYADFRAALLAVDHGRDAGIRYERRAGDDFPAVLFDQQHGVDRYRRAGIADGPCDDGRPALRHLDLVAAALNDCVHSWHLWKGESIAAKTFRCKELLRRRQTNGAGLWPSRPIG